ncbi:MAG TPA: RhuM family protein [Thiobacillaceae bacterium]|nr:RhuM family protein [Thiobacillaceae bacterium]HNU63505.1 RhuM family protein [Thiobacillaceae bacterium]
MSEIAIYQHQDGSIDVRLERDSVWLTQLQLAALFGRDRTVVGRHVRTVFAARELDEESNVQKMHIATSDKPVALYNLDVIISVGYRVKSPEGVRFHRWTSHILPGGRRTCGQRRELAALSLLVAESKPADKEVLSRLNMNMLAGEAA